MDGSITWDSTPVYDGWGFSSGVWSAEDWTNWYEALLTHYDKGQAQIIWAKAWLAGVSTLGGGTGSASGSGWLFDSVPVDARTFDASFRNFLNADGNEILHDAVFSGVLGSTVGNVLSTGVGAGTDVIDAAGNIVHNASSTAVNLSELAKYIIPVIVIIGIGLVAFYGYKQVKKA